MRLIHDFHNFHRFHSVRFGVLAAACGSGLAAYGVALAISPSVVSGVPHWLLTVLTLGSMGFSILAVIGRAIAQPKLPTIAPKP